MHNVDIHAQGYMVGFSKWLLVTTVAYSCLVTVLLLRLSSKSGYQLWPVMHFPLASVVHRSICESRAPAQWQTYKEEEDDCEREDLKPIL